MTSKKGIILCETFFNIINLKEANSVSSKSTYSNVSFVMIGEWRKKLNDNNIWYSDHDG